MKKILASLLLLSVAVGYADGQTAPAISATAPGCTVLLPQEDARNGFEERFELSYPKQKAKTSIRLYNNGNTS